MSVQTLRIVVPAVLILHGIGHWMGILTAVGVIQTATWHSRSWLLTGPLGDPASRGIALVLWVVAFVGFVAAGAGAFGWSVTSGSWRTLAVIASIVSLVALALFWNAFAMLIPNKIGAIAVNVATLIAVLGLHWPPAEVIA